MSRDGRYGSKELTFSTKKAFSVNFNLPHNIIETESLIIPISLQNNLGITLTVTTLVYINGALR